MIRPTLVAGVFALGSSVLWAYGLEADHRTGWFAPFRDQASICYLTTDLCIMRICREDFIVGHLPIHNELAGGLSENLRIFIIKQNPRHYTSAVGPHSCIDKRASPHYSAQGDGCGLKH
jgi:hypothetical protein